MKNFLSSTKGKVISGAITSGIICAAVAVIIVLNVGFRVIAVQALTGITQVINGGKSGDAYVGQHLVSGDDVTVTDTSDLTLSLDTDKYVYAEPDTHFWIVEAKGKKGDTRTKIHLDEGSQLYRIDNKLNESESFGVETPNSTMSVRGTVFRVTCRYDENGELITILEVLEGEVYIEAVLENGGGTGDYRYVKAGECVKIRSNSRISEFIEDKDGNDILDIDYPSIPKDTAKFIGQTIDSGRGLCIDKALLYDYTKINPHVFDGMKGFVASTCKEEGHYYRACSVCGMTNGEVVNVPKAEHDIIEEEIQSTKCTEKGQKIKKCADCGEIIEKEELPAKEHNYDDGKVVKEATTSKPGTILYTCKNCGKTKEEEIPKKKQEKTPDKDVTQKPSKPSSSSSRPTTPSSSNPSTETTPKSQENPCKNGHDYRLTDTKVATCTINGYQIKTCTRCNVQTQTAIPKLGHDYKLSDTKAATCTEDGYEAGKCSRCGVTARKIIDKLGHKISTDSKAATCLEDGYEKTVCTRCGVVYSTTPIAKLSHNYVEDKTKRVEDADELGTTFTLVCSRCGDTITEHHVHVCDESSKKYISNNNRTHKITLTCSCDTIKVVNAAEGCTFEIVNGNEICKFCGHENKVMEAHIKDGFEVYFSGHNGCTKISRAANMDGVDISQCRNISNNNSEFPIYIWESGDGTLNFYSDADKIYLAPNSALMFDTCTNLREADLSFLSLDSSQSYDFYKMFYSCSNLEKVIFGSNLDTSSVTNMGYMFCGCLNLKTVQFGNVWDTSSVESMDRMFHNCNNLESLDVSGWDTSNVTTMENMFYDCNKLQSLDLSGWNPGKVTTMHSMFENCNEIETINFGSQWDTGSVTTMSSMFAGCNALKNADFTGWDTSSVTTMSSMFAGCNSLENPDLSGWDVSNVTTFYYMFSSCTSLTGLNISNWNTGNVNNMRGTFYQCESINSLDLSGWDTSNVTDMNYMFRLCKSIESIDIRSFTNNSNPGVSSMLSCNSANPVTVYTNRDFGQYLLDNDHNAVYTSGLVKDSNVTISY